MVQTTRRKLYGTLLLIASFVVLAACAGPATNGGVVSVTLDQSDFALAIGATAELTAEVEVDGAIGTGVVWSSGDATVATVSSAGLVTGVAEGSTPITVRSAADATKSDALTVTVAEAGVVSVTIDQPDGTVAQGSERALSVTVVSAGVDDAVEWSTANASIATVSPTGVVTGVAVGGPVDITATSVADATKFDTVAITVTAPGDVALSGLTAQVVLGSRVRLDWDATGAIGFDVYAVEDDSLVATSVAGPLGAGVRTATIDLPASTRMTLRVVAHGVGDDVQRSVVPTDVVTSDADTDPYTGGGRTPDAPVPGTLRHVLTQAASGAVVGFAADVTEIDLHGVQFVAPIDAHLILARDVTISGPADRVILRGLAGPAYAGGDPFTYQSRVLYVAPGVTATLDHVTLTGGTFIYFGAGVYNGGTLTIRDSLITGNRAWYLGGGIYNHTGATLTLIDTVVTDNVAAVLEGEVGATFPIRNDPNFPTTLSDGGYGGGLSNRGGTVTATRATFSGNQAKFSGGSIYNEGVLTMTGFDVRGSSADLTLYGAPRDFAVGGGIYTDGTMTLTDGEIEGNDTLWMGGGLFVDREGIATLTTVHFAGNVADFGGGIRHEYWLADGSGNLTMTDTTYDSLDLNVAREGDAAGHDISVEGFDVTPGPTALPGRWVAPTGPDAPHTAR